MLERPKTPAQVPPPLPRTPPLPQPRTARPPAGGALRRARELVALCRAQIVIGARRAREVVRRRRALTAVVAGVLLLGIGAGAVVAFDLDVVPDLDVFGPKTVATARADARARPTDAAAQRNLGHALWAAKKRPAALRAYDRALVLDAGAADSQLVSNLLASFGGRNQRAAEAMIWKHKLVAAEEGLKRLVKSRVHSVRWGAVHTLDRLEKGNRGYWETAYIADLDSPNCDVRRTAVEKLGAIGTRRAITALRDAKADDEKTGGWFRSRCLGEERLDSAEHRILARR
jgi:hypothetical protein